MSKVQTERRRAQRASVSVPLQLSPHKDALQASLVNISTSGLCCQFGEAISEMTLVGVDLELPDAKDPVHVQGAVVRCSKLRSVSPPTYEIGIFFTDMPNETRHRIDHFVAGNLEASE